VHTNSYPDYAFKLLFICYFKQNLTAKRIICCRKLYKSENIITVFVEIQ